MQFDLMPETEPGRRFAALAEQHAAAFAERAAQHDRDGSFPIENIEDMKRSGALLATLPTPMGGLGLESLHDFAVGLNRVGRGDGSTGLAVSMHLFRVWMLAWSRRISRQAADPKLVQWPEKWLSPRKRERSVMMSSVSLSARRCVTSSPPMVVSGRTAMTGLLLAVRSIFGACQAKSAGKDGYPIIGQMERAAGLAREGTPRGGPSIDFSEVAFTAGICVVNPPGLLLHSRPTRLPTVVVKSGYWLG
jgi:hypothetical protein